VAANALTSTITHLTKLGRFRQAADREKEIAQIYLQDAQDLSKACESFERAGEWYAQEDATALVNLCFCYSGFVIDLSWIQDRQCML
jgi:alpha-soluble NSF attachment protein